MGKVRKVSSLSSKAEQGGVLLMVLIIMIVFVAMATYTLRFVVRQSHETIDQEQEEQAFAVADSGVSYAIWLLDPDGGSIAPGDIAALLTIADHPVTDDLGQLIGTFSLVDIAAGTRFIQLRSIGKDTILTDRCQSIAVELRQFEVGESYVVTKWNHQVGYPCS